MHSEVVESFKLLYDDGISQDGGEPVRFAICDVRGDWKWQQATCMFLVLTQFSMVYVLFIKMSHVILISRTEIKQLVGRSGCSFHATICATKYVIVAGPGNPATSQLHPNFKLNFVTPMKPSSASVARMLTDFWTSFMRFCFGLFVFWCFVQSFLFKSDFSHNVGTMTQGPLMKLPRFCLQMIRWDGMHIINLGVDLWVCGSYCLLILHTTEARVHIVTQEMHPK